MPPIERYSRTATVSMTPALRWHCELSCARRGQFPWKREAHASQRSVQRRVERALVKVCQTRVADANGRPTGSRRRPGLRRLIPRTFYLLVLV